jgi:2-C-methyl-D-erythritol 2,4-cyclodiphosphate synthase
VIADVPGVGLGFDVHPWDDRRELRLGGIRFEGESGLAGHSDGDVVCHAIADALLGAAAVGDLGQHFPEDDPATAGLAGSLLLTRTVELVGGEGRRPASVDVTIVCDHPRVADRRDEMRASLARVLDVPVARVSVKATRPEGLGLRGDGIGCLAVAVVT